MKISLGEYSKDTIAVALNIYVHTAHGGKLGTWSKTEDSNMVCMYGIACMTLADTAQTHHSNGSSIRTRTIAFRAQKCMRKWKQTWTPSPTANYPIINTSVQKVTTIAMKATVLPNYNWTACSAACALAKTWQCCKTKKLTYDRDKMKHDNNQKAHASTHALWRLHIYASRSYKGELLIEDCWLLPSITYHWHACVQLLEWPFYAALPRYIAQGLSCISLIPRMETTCHEFY